MVDLADVDHCKKYRATGPHRVTGPESTAWLLPLTGTVGAAETCQPITCNYAKQVISVSTTHRATCDMHSLGVFEPIHTSIQLMKIPVRSTMHFSHHYLGYRLSGGIP